MVSHQDAEMLMERSRPRPRRWVTLPRVLLLLTGMAIVLVPVGVEPSDRWRGMMFLPAVPLVQTVTQVVEVMAEPETLTALMHSPELKEIAGLPAVKRHLDAISADPKLKRALENRDIATVMSSPQWSAMLNDGELFDTIMSRAAAIRGALRNVSAARAKQLAKSAGPGAKQRARQVAQQAKSAIHTP